MKRKILYIFLVITLILITGCNYKKIEDNIKGKDNMKVIINKEEYIVELEDNETAKSFYNMLPQELNMNELNGNEKYIYLDTNLPTNSYTPKHIEQGDVMLFGSNCLVIFYKSFETTYTYTKIGHITNLPDLENDSIIVKFEK